MILEPAEGFPVAASGPDVYRCFVLPTNLAHDSYLEAVDYAPVERGAVHHLIAYIDTTGRGRQLDADDPGPGYSRGHGPGFEADELSFWTAGSEPHRLPDGVGIRIPAQADIVLQVHYHPSGKAGNDRTRVGLYFTRKPIKQALHWNNASSYDFRLPAGDKNVEVKASWFIPVDVEVVAVSPHMHQLGRDMHMSVRLPSGRTQNLIEITDWDPSWQRAYYFQKPISLPAGSVVNVVAHFDNSAHSRNPNQPPKMVKVGLQLRRRDVRRLHRRREKGPGLDRARGPRRPVRDLLEAARTAPPDDGDEEAALSACEVMCSVERPGTRTEDILVAPRSVGAGGNGRPASARTIRAQIATAASLEL